MSSAGTYYYPWAFSIADFEPSQAVPPAATVHQTWGVIRSLFVLPAAA
jgi:hypothetical protein